MKLLFTSFVKEMTSPQTLTRTPSIQASLLQIVSLAYHAAERLQNSGSSVNGAPKSRVRSLIPREKEAGTQERHSAQQFRRITHGLRDRAPRCNSTKAMEYAGHRACKWDSRRVSHSCYRGFSSLPPPPLPAVFGPGLIEIVSFRCLWTVRSAARCKSARFRGSSREDGRSVCSFVEDRGQEARQLSPLTISRVVA